MITIKIKIFFILLQIFLSTENVSAFTSPAVTPDSKYNAVQKRKLCSTSLSMSRNSVSSRKAFATKIASISSAAIFGAIQPAFGLFGAGVDKANAKLNSYGLPPLTSIPDGFTPLVEIYGKASNRETLLVEFLYPVDWVTVLPNIDSNGEEGSIQAGQYSAGDTATLFLTPGKVEDVTTQPKSFFQDIIIKAISRKGDNVYQNFKIMKIEPITGEYKDQKYAIVDFKYELLTGAGFTVDRNGVASVTSEGSNTEVLWTASTRQRYKKTEKNLRVIANSFRCFSDGIQFSL